MWFTAGVSPTMIQACGSASARARFRARASASRSEGVCRRFRRNRRRVSSIAARAAPRPPASVKVQGAHPLRCGFPRRPARPPRSRGWDVAVRPGASATAGARAGWALARPSRRRASRGGRPGAGGPAAGAEAASDDVFIHSACAFHPDPAAHHRRGGHATHRRSPDPGTRSPPAHARGVSRRQRRRYRPSSRP